MLKKLILTCAVTVPMVMAGCTAHPAGERDERDAAIQAGKPFAERFEVRAPATLPGDPSGDELVQAALLSNATVEQRYWSWRSAIEQIPQDGTQPGDVAVFGGLNFNHGSTSLDRATLSGGNDPMNDILLPAKLTAAARRALDNARSAGWRFREAQFDVRRQVLDAWYDYALTAELIRLEQSNAELLKMTVLFTDSANRAGRVGQQDSLKASNDVDLSQNEIARLQSQLPIQRAAINALLGRTSSAPLAPPLQLPPAEPVETTDNQWLTLATQRNPELISLAREIAGNQDAITIARLKYLPDFSLTAGTDLKGITQSLAAMVTVPFFRHEAIDAAIKQAEADLRATESMRRQTASDLGARLVADVMTLHDSDRQMNLFEKIVLPRARQTVILDRSAYETSHATFLDLIESQRSLIAIEKLVAQLRVSRAERLADLESIVAQQESPVHQTNRTANGKVAAASPQSRPLE